MTKGYFDNFAAQEQDDRAAEETWGSLGDATQRIVNQLAEVLRRNQPPSPSIVPSDDPDNRDCPSTSPPHERGA
jgi:hypothetical protein